MKVKFLLTKLTEGRIILIREGEQKAIPKPREKARRK